MDERGSSFPCSRCGAPGYVRHAPGHEPYSGVWCDRCFRILEWTWPVRSPVFLVALFVPLGFAICGGWCLGTGSSSFPFPFP